ncbi:putative phosphotransferase [Legionella geestiana]|uniref:Putative phosphotransferase n=1 Tax=Legionella geestiana TaxID=45065 RepID=A0A0W0TU72_9GAMM|nr:phosphotransferase [Legionella geestiana]KTC99078.1 putative phosphotransferase [Legionella geestiana]QBS12585.1 phosphotransferase [Legionella geestiana]STX54962.1 putative phosphotransferase [Legionella geestiana]
MQNREDTLRQWLIETLSTNDLTFAPLTGDASFRRYFRVNCRGSSYMAMDAPPQREALMPFLSIAALLHQGGVRAPLIHASDTQQGFALLEDFGDTLMLSVLNASNVDTLYAAAFDILHRLQTINASMLEIPVFDSALLLQELALFRDWFVTKLLKRTLSSEENLLITQTFQTLANAVSRQPRVLTHRDYHSRNLMVLATESSQPELGVIDFQDMVYGPWTYDAVSLLKDCYIQWPLEQVESLALAYYAGLPEALKTSESVFLKDFALCGLQRHLKVLGIFSRLSLRDNKPRYLSDLPLVLDYTLAALEGMDEFSDFYRWMRTEIHLP